MLLRVGSIASVFDKIRVLQRKSEISYPSDELFAEHPDFPIEQFTSGASKKKIFDFEKAEVDDAITTIRNFIFPER